MPSKLCLAILIFWLAVTAEALAATFPVRTWTSADGRTIEAYLVEIKEDAVVIARPDQLDLRGEPVEFTVGTGNLSKPDQLYVEKIGKVIALSTREFDFIQEHFPENRIRRRIYYSGTKSIGEASEDTYGYFQRRCSHIAFWRIPVMVEDIRDMATSRMERMDRDTGGAGIGKIAAQSKADAKWIEEKLLPYLDSLDSLHEEMIKLAEKASR